MAVLCKPFGNQYASMQVWHIHPRAECDSELPETSSDGDFYKGVVCVVDTAAYALFIKFLDGTKDWYQLWRSGEHSFW